MKYLLQNGEEGLELVILSACENIDTLLEETLLKESLVTDFLLLEQLENELARIGVQGVFNLFVGNVEVCENVAKKEAKDELLVALFFEQQSKDSLNLFQFRKGFLAQVGHLENSDEETNQIGALKRLVNEGLVPDDWVM